MVMAVAAVTGACGAAVAPTAPAPPASAGSAMQQSPREPPATTAIALPPDGPVHPVVSPFDTAQLARSDKPGYAAGTARAVFTLQDERGESVWGVFDAQRRIVLGLSTPGSTTASRHILIDERTGMRIAELGSVSEKLATELVVDHGARQAVVEIADGSVIEPDPQLPNGVPATMTHLFAGPDGNDVWLMAIGGGHTYVGDWGRRDKTPALTYEIPSPNLASSFETRRIPDGIELAFDDFGSTAQSPCPILRLHRGGAPECVAQRARDLDGLHATAGEATLDVTDSYGQGSSQLAASWLVDGHAGSETFDLPCVSPRVAMVGASQRRAIVQCHRNQPDEHVIFAWVNGFMWSVVDPGMHSNAGRPPSDARVVSVGAFEELVHPMTTDWLDLDLHLALHGPPLEDLAVETGPKFAALEGEHGKQRAVEVDTLKRTLRDIGATPCAGELIATGYGTRFTTIFCGIPPKPGNFNLAIQWSKVIDLERERLYDMPGYAEAVFSDGTVLVSNRTHWAEETLPTGSHLAVYALD